MYLKHLELSGFKSFAKPTKLEFPSAISAVVGPNGSGKSNVVEAIRWALGEQSMKGLRGKKGEDLIFNGSVTAPRLGKASVSVVFDNRKKIFPVDYEEIKITRRVFRDGENEYLINDSKIRLKDIIELLGNVGIGSSCHHIISQGEADRILNSSIKDRRQMLEDALGLKIYQIKKTESERKLEKTEENIVQVEALKREIQPHLRFLKKQAEKAQETLLLKEALKNHYIEYFENEERYLKDEAKKITEEEEKVEKEIRIIEKELVRYNSIPERSVEQDEIRILNKNLSEKELAVNELRERRNLWERELGRAEGAIEIKEKMANEEEHRVTPLAEVRNIFAGILEHAEKGREESALENAKKIFEKIKNEIKEFLEKVGTTSLEIKDISKLKEKLSDIQKDILEIETEERKIAEEINDIKKNIKEKEEEYSLLERKKYELESQLKEFNGILYNLKIKDENIDIQKEELERDKEEAEILVGKDAFEKNLPVSIKDGPWQSERLNIKKHIERLKIKLEDAGLIGNDSFKEYEEVKKRNEFFEKELDDLGRAIESLKSLLNEIDEKLSNNFRVGIEKINKEFQVFFEELFGGGKAELKVITPKKRIKKNNEEMDEGEVQIEENDEGVDIFVSLPKKRIHSLDMLSGGERVLTSIALLFAMTQVNPPPFLILDETDAALDEANSKRYGKMLTSLSQRTQLIVITHNRETMSQAGILYGVTMGSDSISKLLSIKFQEAEKYTA